MKEDKISIHFRRPLPARNDRSLFLTALARKYASKGKGARIVVKDEAANASGSFKARRTAVAVYHAKKLGCKGVIAATSGNYGAAVASQAAMQGLKCIVVQLTVGPELLSTYLSLLEDTGYFNASLHAPVDLCKGQWH